ncbi:hypothetical protein [Nostoc sp.]|uniref:hypothetical protein n=1 Tax=Nostoc sp. TaxID=1180 RepID=UPI002FF7715A
MQIKDYPLITALSDNDLLLIQAANDGAYKSITKANLLAGLSSSAGGTSSGLLLDAVTNVISARSIRKLLTSYAGKSLKAAISESSSQDIGYASNNLDLTALNSFAGSNNIFVSELYDQIGNFNATQSTFSLCPQILTNASIPALHYNSSFLSSPIPASNYPLTIIAVVSIVSLTNGAFIKYGDTNNGIGIGVGNGTVDNSGTNLIGLNEAIAWISSSTPLSTSGLSIVEISSTGSQTNIYLNGDVIAIGNQSYAPTGNYLIGGYSNRKPVCNIYEDIVFNTLITPLTRATIVANMKTYYKIP